MIIKKNRRKAFRSTAYVANAVAFDGSTYLARAAYTGAPTTSKVGTWSVWFKNTGADGNYRIITDNVNNAVRIILGNDNKIVAAPRNATSTNLADCRSSTTTVSSTTWHHFIASFKTNATTFLKCYLNGLDVTSAFTIVDDYVNYSATGNTVGSKTDGTLKWVGAIAELYIDSSSSLDITSATVRGYFRNETTGKPVDLAAQIALGNIPNPIVLLNKPYGTFHQNSGTGGDFLVAAGALTDGGTI
jgi:hypothetical protein